MIARVFHTVRYLKPVQLYRRAYRPKPGRVRPLPAAHERPVAGPWVPAIERENAQIAPDRFRFLNEERRIETWNDSGIPKLWLYNLHYQEHPTSELIGRWVAENPVGTGNGWEPYPLSLRICSWIKWRLAGHALPSPALESIAAQAEFLARSVEFHLLANHLFVNAKALVFAGAFLEGDTAAKWLTLGLRILEAEVREQILADGGHFERSPMYHSLILEDILDLINLGRAFPGLLPDWGPVAARMLAWLDRLVHPDGRIAFFNDAAFGVAPEPRALADYAGRLGISRVLTPLGDSGYIRLENDRAVALFDAAPVGPDYQPGHAHADTLSFELSVGGRRQIVNSGTSTYENNADRRAQRGTAAHNTIRVDGEDSSEVWSAFRVARRARPRDVRTDHRSYAVAAHDGYTRLKNPVLHVRQLDLSMTELRITDTLEARGKHAAELYFHLHPRSEIAVQFDPQLTREHVATCWYPEFNRAEPNTTIVGRWSGSGSVQFVTTIPLGSY